MLNDNIFVDIVKLNQFKYDGLFLIIRKMLSLWIGSTSSLETLLNCELASISLINILYYF